MLTELRPIDCFLENLCSLAFAQKHDTCMLPGLVRNGHEIFQVRSGILTTWSSSTCATYEDVRESECDKFALVLRIATIAALRDRCLVCCAIC